MAAVYSIDLIAKRDRKKKMDSSIVKCWNVHYQTLEEVEEEARLKKQKEREEREKAQRQEKDDDDDGEAEEVHLKLDESAYNRKTGSYSGNYGKQPVRNENDKQKISAILGEKPDAYSAALLAIKEQADLAADELLAELN